MSHRRVALLASTLLASGLLTACFNTNSVSATNPSPRPLTPRPVMSVAIFSSARPTRPFVEVAILKAQQHTAYSGTSDVLLTMRTEAARIGCDALVLNGTSDAAYQSGWGNNTSTAVYEGFWGAGIVYTDTDATAAPAVAVTPSTTQPALTDERDLPLLRMFDRLDKDGDSVLAIAEMPADAAPRLLTFDGNKDGWLTRAELVAGLQARGEKQDLRREVH